MKFDLKRITQGRDPDPGLEPLALGASKRTPWLLWIAVLAGFIILACVGLIAWYNFQQRPVTPGAMTKTTIVVEQGMTPIEIGYMLQSNGLIRSTLAYRMYLNINGVADELKAGTYKIAPSENLASVIGHITEGKASTFTLTFYPGATLYNPTDIDDDKRTDVYTMLRRAGYSDRTIREALKAEYESPLFAGKPAGTDLEGYVYGETYAFSDTASVKDILEHTFDVYYQDLEENNVIEGVKRQGLTLFEAITLASIVQGEVTSYEDMRTVAQVFYLRLEKDMPLGSDVTFAYAADQANEPRRVDYPSPYNTRIVKGLPPGPVSTPGIDALRAVASPSSTEYLYFVSGDDGTTHFSYTNEEHERNVAKYCTELCR